MPLATWISNLHADLEAKIAVAEAKIAAKSKVPAAEKVVEKVAEKVAEKPKKAKKVKVEETPKTPEKAEKAAKAETPKAPKKAVVEDEKRIKRMSPTLTKQLTTVFQDAKKEFKKEHGAEFAKYVNELTKVMFEAKNLSDHMRDFAATIPATNEPEAVPDEDMTEVTFENVKYVVGDISKRVYIADEENGDKFVGFLGIGKFKAMTV